MITPMIPPRNEEDRLGMHRRVRTYLHALSAAFGRVDMLHVTSPDARFEDGEALDQAQSDFWGVPVFAHLLAREDRPARLWEDHGLGLLDLGRQHPFRRYTSRSVVRGLAGHLVPRPDFVFVDRLEAMLPLLGVSGPQPRVLFDLNDVEHKVRIGQLGGGPFTLRTALQAVKLPALVMAERRAVRTAAVTAVCSDLDRAHLDRLGFAKTVVTVPNAVALPGVVPGVVSAPTLLFLGGCAYLPNVEGAERLVRRIWPLVRAAIPEARLILAGARTDLLPSRAEFPSGVEYRGFVHDLDALYAESRVVTCPLLNGGGTRLKLVEAAAYARPMVSTAKGAEGLAFKDGQDILLRETDEAFAEACVSLLRDDLSCARLGAAARQTMARLYEVGAVERQIGDVIRCICAAA